MTTEFVTTEISTTKIDYTTKNNQEYDNVDTLTNNEDKIITRSLGHSNMFSQFCTAQEH